MDSSAAARAEGPSAALTDPDSGPEADRPTCANCREPLGGREGSNPRARDCAWKGQCSRCAAEIEGHLELVMDRPGGKFIQIYRCLFCGSERTCRPGWTTRCHVCHDNRTASAWLEDARDNYQSTLAESDDQEARELQESARLFANTGAAELTLLDIADFVSAKILAAELERRAQTGWTLLGTDISGLPWYYDPEETASHGTWAVHDACGRIQKLARGRGYTECEHCPTDPASRTHRARGEDRHLLYLVGYKNVIKFGHGNEARVRAHLRHGAHVIRVLEGRHRDVVQAELVLKRRFAKVRRKRTRPLPRTFGAGTEVLPASMMFDLAQALDGMDVTHQFSPGPSEPPEREAILPPM